ncbi:MAG: hypothetical protein AB7E70_08940 [Hyphomicrobiaceae bacterium]
MVADAGPRRHSVDVYTTLPMQRLSGMAFTERLTPFRVLMGALAIWLVAFVLAPVSPRWPQSGWPILALLSGYGFLVLGFVLPALFGIRFKRLDVKSDRLAIVFRICLLLAVVGVGARLIDYFVIRGIDLDDNVFEMRRALSSTGSSFVSVVAALLTPFGLAALLLAAIGRHLGIFKRIGIVPLVVASSAPALTVLLASRTQLLALGLCIFVTFALLARRIRPGQVALASAAAFLAILVFSYMFIWRLEQMGISYQFASRYSAYTHVVPLAPWYLDMVDASGSAGALLVAFASLFQYALSGTFEFFYLLELKDGNFAHGDYQFFIIAKLVAVFAGKSSTAATQVIDVINPRVGVFQSFFGPAYIDFGYFFPVFCIAYGFVAEMARLSARAGNPYAFPLYVFTLMQIMLVPMVSGLLMGAGVISNLAFAGLALLATFYNQLKRAGR